MSIKDLRAKWRVEEDDRRTNGLCIDCGDKAKKTRNDSRCHRCGQEEDRIQQYQFEEECRHGDFDYSMNY